MGNLANAGVRLSPPATGHGRPRIQTRAVPWVEFSTRAGCVVARLLDAVKRAAGTTAFVVVFASFTGFLGQASVATIDLTLLAWTAAASIIGALIGSWLMHRKLKAAQVKTSIGVLLFFIAATMAYKLIA